MKEVGSGNLEVGSRNAEVGIWKWEVGIRKWEVGIRKWECGSGNKKKVRKSGKAVFWQKILVYGV